MQQTGFFNFETACERLDKKQGVRDILFDMNKYIDWTIFEKDLLAFRKSRRKAETGRKPFDSILMIKILIVQSLYNLSDEAMEFQIRDRLSFMRFLGLSFESRVPDARTIWRFRNELAQANMVEKLFERFDEQLHALGLIAYGGQIVDATITEVPVQHNTREENEKVKEGEVPEGWSEKKRSHKDTDARWTEKNGKAYFGYKNHIDIDRGFKVIRRYKVTAASTHDSQVLKEIVDDKNTNKKIWADSAYRSAALLLWLLEQGFREQIQRRKYRNKMLTQKEQQGNRTRSRVRSRVEHVFGAMKQKAKDLTIRAVGLVRAKASIGLRNLSYNLTRAVWLQKNGGQRVGV